MNKRTKKTKAPHIRILAWVLCLVCLCAAVPTVAIATGGEEETEPVVETTEAVQEQAEATLYERLMAAASCEGVYAILDGAETADVEALTYDELTAIIAYVETLADDGCKDALLEDLAVQRDGDATVIDRPGGSDQGYTLSMSHYNPSTQVYYMVSTTNKAMAADQDTITRVTLAGNTVPNPKSVTPSGWSDGPTLNNCYPGLQKNGNSTTASLEITPAAGYYVTRVVVACTGGQSNTTPFSCDTWNANAAYEQSFEASSVGTVTVALPSEAFGHSSDSGKYCILIVVAPIPTPLYVEYNYGTIGELLGDAYASSPFANADDWTDDNTGNVYKPNGDTSDGGVKTEDTQFKYTYETTSGMTDAAKAAAVQSWKHTTNTVTEEAKAAAASVGYYFTGWQYVYYTKVEVTETRGSYNNYEYEFSNPYSAASSVNENTSLTLITNVRLVAQWAPIELNVTKTVTGLSSISEFLTYSNTYKITLQKLQEDGTYEDVVDGGEVEYTIIGDSSLTYTFAASGAKVTAVITPGTYRVVERWYSEGCYDLHGSDKNAYCTTTYPVQTVEVGMDGTVQELKVLNTYSSKPATYDLTVKKTLSGDMYSKTKEFAFTVTYVDVDGNTQTASFNLGMNGTYVIEGIQVNTQVTVKENPDGYTFTLVENQTTVEGTTGETSYTFTMPKEDVTVVFNNELNGDINTGVVLEALPYVLILVAAGVAALLLLRKRRYDDEV